MNTLYKDVKANGYTKAVIAFMMEKVDDDTADFPDNMDDGFWPSLDKESAGYVGDDVKNFAEQYAKAKERMEAWERGDWNYIGIRAKAYIAVPIGQNSTCNYELESAGLWGIESDSCYSYMQEVFEEQKADI